MPRMVEELTENEKVMKQEIEKRFSPEQQCAFYLTKTIRSVHQMTDEQVRDWNEELRGMWKEYKQSEFPFAHLSDRKGILMAYSVVLTEDQLYEFHLDYWLRHYQEALSDEIAEFLSGVPPHLTQTTVTAA